MEGPARQWFQGLTPPTQWADTPAAAATQGAAATPAVVGMRSVFTTKKFLQDSFARYQESKLRNRKQGAKETAVEYYYEVMNLCRLMDPNMAEAAKIHHLYHGLKRTLVEKVWVLQPKTGGVAAIGRKQRSNKAEEEPLLKQLLEVQQLQEEIIAMKKRPSL